MHRQQALSNKSEVTVADTVSSLSLVACVGLAGTGGSAGRVKFSSQALENRDNMTIGYFVLLCVRIYVTCKKNLNLPYFLTKLVETGLLH